LVGSLDALYFANYGYSVHVFESRPDPRKEETVAGRSINLALSKRGIESLRKVGVDATVVNNGIPMHARMIHSHSGDQSPIPYGKKQQVMKPVINHSYFIFFLPYTSSSMLPFLSKALFRTD